MRKYIAYVAAAVAVMFTACDVQTDEEPGGTAVEKMAGTWIVTFEQSLDEYYYAYGYTEEDPALTEMAVEELDSVDWVDLFGTGKVTMMTFNTSANVNTEMWFYDTDFWDAKVRCDVNYSGRTFSCEDVEAYEYAYGDCVVNIKGGQVLEGAATTVRGVAADSIIAYVYYSDFADYYGMTYMKVSGFRYTGYTEDMY